MEHLVSCPTLFSNLLTLVSLLRRRCKSNRFEILSNRIIAFPYCCLIRNYYLLSINIFLRGIHYLNYLKILRPITLFYLLTLLRILI